MLGSHRHGQRDGGLRGMRGLRVGEERRQRDVRAARRGEREIEHRRGQAVVEPTRHRARRQRVKPLAVARDRVAHGAGRQRPPPLADHHVARRAIGERLQNGAHVPTSRSGVDSRDARKAMPAAMSPETSVGAVS